MKRQSIVAKKAEVDFRKKLFQQQVDGDVIFTDEFDAQGIVQILADRMQKTLTQMTSLNEKNIKLSPYVEIGAERCQRSLVMENDLKLSGAALDISYDMLKSCDYYREVFSKRRRPLRICCDANTLPFVSNSVPFVFCYETLHHFPNPEPIVNEIHRILSPGGHFFFDEEPYKQVAHINLYTGHKIYSRARLNRSKIRKIFDFFFSDTPCNEIEHGIIENHDLQITQWRRILSIFDEKDINLLSSIMKIHTKLYSPESYPKFILAYLAGGNISGVCRKPGHDPKNTTSIMDVIACPSCIESRNESILDYTGHSFLCHACGRKFSVIGGVVFLFSDRTLEILYPEIAGRTKGRNRSASVRSGRED